MSSITQALQFVNHEIQQALAQAHRPSDAVDLLAVSKTKPLSDIAAAYQAGQRKFGENYVQEGVDKINLSQQQAWLNDPIEWHFIGPLQSNKTRLVAEHFDWMQTLDRAKIADRLAAQRPSNMAPLQVCIQVNISGEQAKSGVSLEDVNHLAAHISQQPQLCLRGLMAIPQNLNQGQELAQQFAAMAKKYAELQSQYASVDTLSMGMSGDMQLAINNGSTMVRVGSAIFGQRS
ncbi:MULTISPECIES: YggS family pyridoxal phosphate-dependent enzyme [unclassified Agarivorans]|uniref:YggS family pyridoxal phosphate-dependent enzyme n=1 Tax=unclassified Agarivorans TaxID=2636026 RepID=UPI0026E3C3D3|nr:MULTISPECIES: YggS family pyridoxal phosphate-dependent enzyme [unclassified Agarivorans]MDO6685144.1 YggS family pyridoxal phosphate-dependent enzyme [Agarivorans sp. 3_MG-2023]MDO6715684.1 YggS family pyridoxal phosphate-dependent enzyme [Agarivorans sp. 2_MG-2023]